MLRIAEELKYIDKVPHFNTILNYLRNKELTPILKELLTLSSLPLKEVERKFAVDATGFSACQYTRWMEVKGKTNKWKSFIKAHAMCGVFTNTITSLEITDGYVNDITQFPTLVSKTANYFKMDEVSADKGYISRLNLNVVKQFGAMPYIPFKKNAQKFCRGSTMWGKCYKLFKENPDEFYKHYHLRSNIESTFSMIKRKFGAKLFTKNFISQTNELYLKCICHNISVLIHSIFELGIDIDLNKCAESIPAQQLTI